MANYNAYREDKLSTSKKALFEQRVGSFGAKLDALAGLVGDLKGSARTGEQQSVARAINNRVTELRSSLKYISNSISPTPKSTLVSTTVNLENAIITFMAQAGSASRISADPRSNVQTMQSMGYFNRDLKNACVRFFDLEQSLVNSMSTSQSDFGVATQTGREIIRSVESLPTSKYEVINADVPLYSDAEATVLVSNAVGVIIDNKSTADGKTLRQIFPTTRVGYYKPGMRLTWEWQRSPQWGATWYKDPRTGEIEQAFGGAMNFTPRPLTELLIARR